MGFTLMFCRFQERVNEYQRNTLMKIKEAASILKSIGWRIYMRDGDRYAQFKLFDKTVQLFYGVHRATKYQKFGADFSISTDEFSAVCSQIRSNGYNYWPLVVSWSGIDIRVPEIKEEHIHQASQMALDWAKEQDLHQALLNYAALPTTSPGTEPVLHLSALALLGDIEKIKSYQKSFEAGDRLGFVPYITKDYIDRAVAIAEQHIAAD